MHCSSVLPVFLHYFINTKYMTTSFSVMSKSTLMISKHIIYGVNPVISMLDKT